MDLFRLTELEEAIQRSEQRWTALLKATPDSAFSLAQDGIIQFVYSDKTDWIPAAKLGSNLYDSLLPDDHRILSKCLERVFEIGDPRGCELRSAISGGDIRNWSFHLGLIGEVRTAVGALVVVREIDRSYEKMEQQGLEQRMESLGRFARSLVHNSNNFLTVASIHSQLLLKRIPELDPLRKDVEKIKKAGDEAGLFTGRLALINTIGGGPRPRSVDLNSLITTSEGALRDLLGIDIQLETELAPKIGQVSIDPEDFEQILMILALNAQEAMPKGGRLLIATGIAGETRADCSCRQ